MADRAAIAVVTALLRDARDKLDAANEPFDARLGSIQSRIGLILNDLRSVPIAPAIIDAAGHSR